MTAPTPPRPDENQAPAAPSLAEIDALLALAAERHPLALGLTATRLRDAAVALRAEVSRLTGALAAETEAREQAEAELKQLSEMHDTVLAVRQETIDALAEREGECARLRLAAQHANDHADAAIEEVERLRVALTEARIWHEEKDKAFSKQPPTNAVNWQRAEHQEQMRGIEAALAPDAEKGGARDE